MVRGENMKIDKCKNKADISSENSNIQNTNIFGGIIGCVFNGTNSIKNCNNYGNIETSNEKNMLRRDNRLYFRRKLGC